jgi:hypothetical protein
MNISSSRSKNRKLRLIQREVRYALAIRVRRESLHTMCIAVDVQARAAESSSTKVSQSGGHWGMPASRIRLSREHDLLATTTTNIPGQRKLVKDEDMSCTDTRHSRLLSNAASVVTPWPHAKTLGEWHHAMRTWSQGQVLLCHNFFVIVLDSSMLA